jgi:hypothetical protein
MLRFKVIEAMTSYKHFPLALSKVIDSTHGGNQSDFADFVGITAASISRLCAGTRDITKSTLEKISHKLSDTHRKQLYLAAIKDFLPEDGHQMLFGSSNWESIVMKEDEAPWNHLDSDSKKILLWLNQEVCHKKEIRTWLKILSEWIQGK